MVRKLYAGLETRRALFSPEAEGYLRYQISEVTEPRHAPFAETIKVNPPLHDDEIFAHELWIRLGPDNFIEQRQSDDGRWQWRIPEGTEILDLFYLKNETKSLYEGRIARKLVGDRWAYGLYRPVSRRTVKLVEESGQKAVFRLKKGDALHLVETTRLDPHDCSTCHDTPQRIGEPEPNSFGPQHRDALQPWVEAFQKRMGRSPFVRVFRADSTAR